jgi:hypothetical protein
MYCCGEPEGKGFIHALHKEAGDSEYGFQNVGVQYSGFRDTAPVDTQILYGRLCRICIISTIQLTACVVERVQRFCQERLSYKICSHLCFCLACPCSCFYFWNLSEERAMKMCLGLIGCHVLHAAMVVFWPWLLDCDWALGPYRNEQQTWYTEVSYGW